MLKHIIGRSTDIGDSNTITQILSIIKIRLTLLKNQLGQNV